MTFADAAQYCFDLGSSLATPNDLAENNHYANLVDEFTPMGRYWVGIDRASGSWTRLDNLDLDFENWNSGQGNHGDVAVSTKTSLAYPKGPWNGQWESFADDGSMTAHVFCRAASGWSGCK